MHSEPSSPVSQLVLFHMYTVKKNQHFFVFFAVSINGFVYLEERGCSAR